LTTDPQDSNVLSTGYQNQEGGFIMKRLWTTLGGAALACSLFATPAMAGDQKIPLEKLPAAVRDTLTKEAQGGQIEGVKLVSDDGKLYMADVKIAGSEYDLYVTNDGKLVGKRKD
jgi:hypothetical protein